MFEIEVLNRMNSSKLLDPLVFGGGSMLRLCHELNRYSVDLDFWFIKKIPQDEYFKNISLILNKDYEITDKQKKHFTLLFELRSTKYPRRLKIEIRRKIEKCNYQEKIAFSKFSTKQILLKAHTLEQTMENKIRAFLDRGEIRDCFDLEFLLRKGIELPVMDKEQLPAFEKKLSGLNNADYKVKLGSILDSNIRDFYFQDRFSFLREKLADKLLY
ncbi:nucleotidyl transferase AbiEii/AbiGii toxin family protein [Thermodesulfobacteriota bacterium]